MKLGFRGSDVIAGPGRTAARGSSYLVGLILVALGVLALVFADALTVASIIAFGVLLVLGGLAELVHAIRAKERDRSFLAFVSGLLSIAVGGVMILRPQVGATGSGALVAAWLFAAGLFRGLTAILDRYRYWGWDLCYGILSMVLGVWVTQRLPTSAMWLLGTVIAVELMARGIAVMGASLGLQRRAVSSATPR